MEKDNSLPCRLAKGSPVPMPDYTAMTGPAFECAITPRYTDLDTWRHVNNSRIYQLHQEARILAHIERFGADAWFSDEVRLRPLRSITQYQQVTWYGSDVQARVQVQQCARDTYRVRSELSQNGQWVGTQDCVMGAFLKGQRVDLPESVYASLQIAATGTAEPLPASDYIDVARATDEWPMRQQLSARYADLDADSQRSEAALARYMEQARFGAIRGMDLGGLGILIAAADISFLHYRPGWKPVELGSGISRMGNTSFVFTGAATSEHGLQAVANSVMVVIDQASGRPAPLTDAIREQLTKLKL
jgi:acyl-CoA thioesterase FadM